MEIVIVSAESRRRDNLLSMLESIFSPKSIKMVEVCSDVIKIANPECPAIVFVDCRDLEKSNRESLIGLILNRSVHYVVSLVSHSNSNPSNSNLSSTELIYDEINIEMLKNLLVDIQLQQKAKKTLLEDS